MTPWPSTTPRGLRSQPRALNLERRRWRGSARTIAPEPDVMVMDADYEPRQCFVDHAYVVAEIVSDTDNEPVPGENEPWIAIKRRLYLAHAPCEAVILIDPYRVDLRTKGVWSARRLTSLDEWLII